MLTDAQMQTLKAIAAADQTASTYLDGTHDQQLAEWFNAVADTNYYVWRTNVTDREIFSDPAFDWTRVDNLTSGRTRIHEWMFKFGSINPSQANIRAGIAAVWTGTAADLAVQAAILAKCKANPSRAVKVLAAGTGTSATPATMTFEGIISPADASTIRSMP